MPRAQQVRLTGRAARYLKILQEFGHFDQQGLDDLLLAAAEMYGGTKPVLIDVPEVRRLAASWLTEAELPSDRQAMLDEDWPLLFS
jgi:hypothetical protein